MLIHNADRCVRNPNVLTNGAELKTYDHELAFPFLLPILGEKTEPWKIKHMEWATQHVFFRGLKGKNLDITGCTDRLLQLDSGIMNSVAAVAPSNWVTSDLDKIWQHIEAVKLNAGLFADEVSGVLA
jgi:hypothetical protein